jgi:hypothetical protein
MVKPAASGFTLHLSNFVTVKYYNNVQGTSDNVLIESKGWVIDQWVVQSRNCLQWWPKQLGLSCKQCSWIIVFLPGNMWPGYNIDQGPANLPFIIIIIILHASNPLHVTCHRQKDIWDIILSPHLQQNGCHFVPSPLVAHDRGHSPPL